ncbi:MAG: sugar ABC transporter ATP-binding protein [Treponema sp.]|nr:sugar ABC transporter ATP-binding protein [Treponema sp.]
MVLETRGITKRFGPIFALEDVSLSIRPGEFHALAGENGAGKSTLIKILGGIYPADGGEIRWQGEPAAISSPRRSMDLGIRIIHQDRNLVPSFSGMENVYLGLGYEKRGLRIDWKKMRNRVSLLMDELGIHIPLDTPARDLSPSQRTQVEIIRSMMTRCGLLILDEPTASFTAEESDRLFAVLKKVRSRGAAVLYVSHRLDEVTALSDRITILRNGRLIDTLETERPFRTGDAAPKKAGTLKDLVISLMTGDPEPAGERKTGRSRSLGDCLLEVSGLSSRDGLVKDVSLRLRSGEILGLFGLGGSGRTETLECIYGIREKAGGSIRFLGKDYPRPSARVSLTRGMVLISEDRRGRGLIPALSVKENTVISVLDRYSRLGYMDDRAQERDTVKQIETLSIKTGGPRQRVEELSGGNQQKVVFAKALMSLPEIILCDDPTQAVDVKTRHEIHALLRELAGQGRGVIFVSPDLRELLETADTIQIISRGRSGTCFENSGVGAEEVLSLCYAEQERKWKR